MKVLVISAAFPPMKVGEADHALHLCKRLAACDVDVHVLTTRGIPHVSSQSFALHPIMPDWGWSNLPRFTAVLRRCSPDSILLMYTPRDYRYRDMITFTPTITKAISPRARFVTQFETALIGPQGSSAARAARKVVAACLGPTTLDYVFGTLLCKSDRVIALSERHLNVLVNQFPWLNGKGLVVPPPPLLRMCEENPEVARERGRRALAINRDEFLIAHYGYLYKEKGIETLLLALSMLIGEKNNARLVMIGGNPGAEHDSSYVDTLKKTAVRLGVLDKIIWTGQYAPESDQASLYLYAADACVFPFSEGVALNRSSVAAATAHRLPIVTTRGARLESAFIDGENVLLCPPKNPGSLAKAINSLIDSPELRERLCAGARELARQHFSWDRAVRHTIEALQL